MIQVFIPMDPPIAKARPRFNKGRVFTPSKTVSAEHSIAYAVNIEMIKLNIPIITGAVSINIEFRFKKQKTKICQRPYHTVKPDIDNLIKTVLDSLNRIAYKDDSQIVEIKSNKTYIDNDKAGIYISIEEVPCFV